MRGKVLESPTDLLVQIVNNIRLFCVTGGLPIIVHRHCGKGRLVQAAYKRANFTDGIGLIRPKNIGAGSAE